MFAATMFKRSESNQAIPGIETGQQPERNRAATGMKPGSPEWARSWLGVVRSSWTPLEGRMVTAVTTRSPRGHYAVTMQSQRDHDAVKSQHGYDITTRHSGYSGGYDVSI